MRLTFVLIVWSLAIAPALASAAPAPKTPVFDVHAHLREGEASLKTYEAEVSGAKLELAGFAGMALRVNIVRPDTPERNWFFLAVVGLLI